MSMSSDVAIQTWRLTRNDIDSRLRSQIPDTCCSVLRSAHKHTASPSVQRVNMTCKTKRNNIKSTRVSTKVSTRVSTGFIYRAGKDQMANKTISNCISII